nr:MAG: hypothetical protein EDM05_26390 [Leptolyngbya sp. IPPAS B-1204]
MTQTTTAKIQHLTDARQDYPAVEFPDSWPFNCEIETLLSEKGWATKAGILCLMLPNFPNFA